MKKVVFLFFFLISISTTAQGINLDKYKYVIVADKFDFLKSSDQYKTSSLTKFLFKKKAFKVFLSNEDLPKELNDNRCLALFASVKNESSMFRIKNSIIIKDCYGKVIYTSKIGISKIKDYERGYQEAIRNAYNSMEEDFIYSYKEPSLNTVNTTNVVKKAIVKKDAVKVNLPVVEEKVIVKNDINSTIETLYAQPKENGFQLINLTPEVVFILLKTNTKDVFIIKGKNGTLTKKGENWIAEFYENNKLVIKTYNIKF
ncbi:hypothetical protein BTO18_08535 [Polaribacter porphyrae]|uniref:TPM domain-containing protein n=1 Tax=Polaribacter porphyrae TaxID=1137780 RepID=A0A2S7WTP4_9FLAO|nr:hypothetical protein BTO18_08535 [Polaribacter porphyrae]